jgi:hypothetical protein
MTVMGTGVESLGAIAVTCESEFIMTFAPLVPNSTFVVWVRPVPVITTGVPATPLVGLKLSIWGVTRNGTLLDSVVLGSEAVPPDLYTPGFAVRA